MKIQVLGSGCATCHKLYEITKQATAELGIQEPVEYLTGNEGLKMIVTLGAMGSPVIAVNNQAVLTGFTPDINKIKAAINSALK